MNKPLSEHVSKPVIAAFDFDKTITTCDTFLPFLVHAVGYFKTTLCLLLNMPLLVYVAFTDRPRQKAKEIVLKWLFEGSSAVDFQKKADLFARTKLCDYIRPEAIKRIQWHQDQGHRCVLVSASIENYIHPWAADMGIRDTLASRLEVTALGKISGLFKGRNCRGSEKVRRLIERMGPRSEYILYAYGDSNGDKEMLASADFAFYRHIPS